MTVPAPDVSPACACVPVQELDDDAVGVAYLKRAFAPLLGPQWHRNGDAFGLQPGHFGPQVVHFEGEDEPGGVIVALVFGQHVHTAAPVAVMAWPGAPPVAEFAAAGAVRPSGRAAGEQHAKTWLNARARRGAWHQRGLARLPRCPAAPIPLVYLSERTVVPAPRSRRA